MGKHAAPDGGAGRLPGGAKLTGHGGAHRADAGERTEPELRPVRPASDRDQLGDARDGWRH